MQMTSHSLDKSELDHYLQISKFEKFILRELDQTLLISHLGSCLMPVNFRILLVYTTYHYRYLEVQTASISRCVTPQHKVQVRDPCPQPPPPPPPKPKDDSAFWGAMAVVFVAAGFAVLA
ncbi:jg25535, partial [Pararge aegeria aegeria]